MQNHLTRIFRRVYTSEAVFYYCICTFDGKRRFFSTETEQEMRDFLDNITASNVK